MKLESIHIKNFRAFKDASMTGITNFCVIVEANGAGKSNLFQMFGFLRDENDCVCRNNLFIPKHLPRDCFFRSGKPIGELIFRRFFMSIYG